MIRITEILHDMRNCRWSQPPFCATCDGDEHVCQAQWECVRTPDEARPVTEAECERCEHWEPGYTF